MTTFRSAASELPLSVDRLDSAPLTAQIAGQLRAAMTGGRLGTGERLPPTRVLAASLGVSRTVVTGAYSQLFAEGWIEGRHGSGTYVADGAPGAAPRAPVAWPLPGTHTNGLAAPMSGAPPIEMRPGIPWAQGIDRPAWRRAWRSAAADPPGPGSGPAGLPALRAALSAFLRRGRGVRCEPDQILVTRGVAASLGLIAAALLAPGDMVGVEEPGYPAARAVFAAHGARVIPCRVDADGLVVDGLPDGLRLVYTTPAHQYPLGGRLPVPRRQALAAWARAAGAILIEDDYDGEFRYDVAPLPALFGLDADVVIYLGTTTKILSPAVRVGWLAARPGVVSRLAGAAASLGEGAGEMAQRAVLALLANGDLERHIRRMRHVYARRRSALMTGLQGVPGRLLGDDAGMHAVLLAGANADAVAAAAMDRGVAVATLRRYFAGAPTLEGLVLGYGGATAGEVGEGCRILAGVLGA